MPSALGFWRSAARLASTCTPGGHSCGAFIYAPLLTVVTAPVPGKVCPATKVTLPVWLTWNAVPALFSKIPEFSMLAVVSHFVMWLGVPVPLKGGGTGAEFGAELGPAAGFDVSCASVKGAVESNATKNKRREFSWRYWCERNRRQNSD